MGGTRRDRRIQALRGVAVSLVVLLHALKMVDGRPGSIADLLPNDDFGAIGVDLFFVISGAVMAGVIERAPSPGVFLRDRAVRLLPMWWLAVTVFLDLGNFLPVQGDRDGLRNSLTLLPLLDRGGYSTPIPGVGWTLGFETLFYLVVAAALAARGRVRRWGPAVTLALLGALGAAWRPHAPAAQLCCNAILLEFVLGMAAMHLARTRAGPRVAPALTALGILGVAIACLRPPGFHTDPGTVMLGAASLRRTLCWGVPCALLLAGLTARRDRGSGSTRLTRLGDASYSIYLVHTLFTAVSIHVWPWWGAIGRDVLVGILVACGLGAGVALHRWVERPLLARLRRRQASVAASASTVSPRSLTSAKPPSTWMSLGVPFAAE